MWKGGRTGCGVSHRTSPRRGSTLHDDLIQCLGGLSVVSVLSLLTWKGKKVKIEKTLKLAVTKRI